MSADLTYFEQVRPLSLVLAFACACSSDPATPAPDADTGGPDATGSAACGKVGGAAMPVPMHMTGTLAGADLQAPQNCTTVDAPFGVESAGPDSVVHVGGLMVGQRYVVRMRSTSDLGFYVITGCSTPTGPSDAECLLFEDTAPELEVGRFVATQPDAYIVADFFASTPPADPTFTLDVYAEACSDSSQCNGGTPACVDGECVECVTSFDCRSAANPVCDDTSHSCGPGVDACTADDPGEPGNDGPGGATPIAINSAGTGGISGQICSNPMTEADFASFQVMTVGETWTLSLQWTGSRDLDLAVFDAGGQALGLSFYEHPETVTLTYLQPGTYYAQVSEFSSTADPSPVTYTLSASRAFGPGCTRAADCAVEHRNQIYRGQCSAGACVSIDGAAAVGQGGACDSTSDCTTGLHCPSFFFVANADTRDTCEPTCNTDTDCALLGADFVCTTYLITNFCVHKCAIDDQCPTSLSMAPASGPWYRLSCDVPTGRCL